MFFTTVCPSCGSTLQLDTEFVNDDARCGRCGTVFVATPIERSPPQARPIPRRQPVRDDSDAPRRRRSRPDGSGLATASLILGIANLVLWCCPPLGLITCGIGLVLGAQGLQSRSRWSAVWGILLSTVGLIISIAGIVFFSIVVVEEERVNTLPANGNRAPFFQAFP